MPKKIVSTEWTCNICGKEFRNRSEALRCEQKGVFAPAVHLGQMVNVLYPNGDSHEGIVCQIVSEFFTSPFLHEGPLSYKVCLENGDVRPADREMLLPKNSIVSPRQPNNVLTWEAFWQKFRRDDPDMRKRVQDYLRAHDAEYALRRGKLQFRGTGKNKGRKK